MKFLFYLWGLLIFLTFFFTVLDDRATKRTVALSQQISALSMEIQKIKPVKVTVTAYSPENRQTDDTPTITAFSTKVKPWTIAVSRDLFNAGWVAGKKVYIEGVGVFVVNDLMHKRKSNHVDIFFWTRDQAIEFGVKKSRAILLEI